MGARGCLYIKYIFLLVLIFSTAASITFCSHEHRVIDECSMLRAANIQGKIHIYVIHGGVIDGMSEAD